TCPCAVRDAGGKFQPRLHIGCRTRERCASPSWKGKPEALYQRRPPGHTRFETPRHTAEAGTPPRTLLTSHRAPILIKSDAYFDDTQHIQRPPTRGRMMDSLAWFDSLVGLLSLLIGVLLHKWFTDRRLGDAAVAAKKIVAEGERDAEGIRKAAELEAREAALKARGTLEDEARRSERELKHVEQRIIAKEEELGRN